jgi:hypothetical protein
MSLYSCLENVIGFAREECKCIDDWDASYALSDSGLYISEVQGMSLDILDSLGGCEDIWDKMINARTNAINAFKIDLAQELSKYKEPTRKSFSGDIGGRYADTGKKITSLITESNYYGIRMYSDIQGGKYILRGVSLILNTTEAVNLEIYDEYDLLDTIALSSVANRPHKTDITPIELSLDRNYYFLIAPVGRAYSNKLTCNCGGFRWCFDIDNPCYRLSRDGWTEWVMAAGVYGDAIDDREDWTKCGRASGMILHGNFVCDVFDNFCRDESDFISNEIDTSMAYALLYKASEFLTTYIMASSEVSRYTLLGMEQLNENRIYYAERYKVMIDWLAKSMEDNDCLRCRPPQGMRMRSQRL